MNKLVIMGIAGLTLGGMALWSIGAKGDDGAPGDSFQVLTALTDTNRIVEGLSFRLKLTGAQKQQVQAIVDDEKQTAAPQSARLRDEIAALRQASESRSFDQDQVTTLANQTADTAAGLIVDLEQAKSQVYAILTPDQRQLAAQQRAEGETKFREKIATLQTKRGQIFQRIAARLGLTDQQQQQIQTILTNERSARQPVVAELVGDWQAMQALTADGSFDQPSVTVQAKKAEPATASLIVDAVRTKSEVLAVLTPDQRAQLAQMRDRLRSKLAQRIMQMRPGGGDQTFNDL